MTERPTRLRINWRALGIGLAISVITFGLLWTLRQQGGLEYLELKTYDALIRHQQRDYSFSSNFLLVGIDEADILHFKQHPVSDKTLAQLLTKLEEGKPRAIGVDIVRDFPVPDQKDVQSTTRRSDEWDSELQYFLNDPRSRNVTWAIVPTAAGTFVRGLKNSIDEKLGSVELISDVTDESVRRGMLFSTDRMTGKRYPSLAYQMTATYLAAEPVPIDVKPAPGRPDLVQFGSTVINKFGPNDGAYINADDRGYQFLLDYRGPWAYPRVSARDVLEGRVKSSAIDGKIVVVGMTTFTNREVVRTPVDPQLYALYLHAISAEQLLRVALRGERSMSPWPNAINIGWAFLWSVLGAVAGYGVRSFWKWSLVVVAGVGILILIASIQINRGVWMPLLPPAILWASSSALMTAHMSSREKEDRSLLITLFSRQVSPAVAQKIWTQRDQLLSDGKLITQELRATVLVSDLANFTAISQSLTPADLMRWLNEYTGAMSEIVEKHGGIVDKYVGDAVLAIFGAPVPTAPQASAASAVACALEMRASFAGLKSKWNTPLMLGMRMRVGIHTGPMVVGTIGSGEREAYAVIGDAVNTAQRIESHDKDTMQADIAADGCRIIISDATRELIGGQFRLRRLGEIPSAGETKMLAIHGVIQ